MSSEASEARRDHWRIREVADHFTRALKKGDWPRAAELSTGALRRLVAELDERVERGHYGPRNVEWAVQHSVPTTSHRVALTSRVASLPWREIDTIVVSDDTAAVEYVGQHEGLTLVFTGDGWRVSGVE